MVPNEVRHDISPLGLTPKEFAAVKGGLQFIVTSGNVVIEKGVRSAYGKSLISPSAKGARRSTDTCLQNAPIVD